MPMLSGGVRCGAFEAALDLEPQAKHVPLQRAVLPHRFVGKPTELVERQDAGLQAAEHRPTAFGAEIDGKKMSTHEEGSYVPRRAMSGYRLASPPARRSRETAYAPLSRITKRIPQWPHSPGAHLWRDCGTKRLAHIALHNTSQLSLMAREHMDAAKCLTVMSLA